MHFINKVELKLNTGLLSAHYSCCKFLVCLLDQHMESPATQERSQTPPVCPVPYVSAKNQTRKSVTRFATPVMTSGVCSSLKSSGGGPVPLDVSRVSDPWPQGHSTTSQQHSEHPRPRSPMTSLMTAEQASDLS